MLGRCWPRCARRARRRGLPGRWWTPRRRLTLLFSPRLRRGLAHCRGAAQRRPTGWPTGSLRGTWAGRSRRTRQRLERGASAGKGGAVSAEEGAARLWPPPLGRRGRPPPRARGQAVRGSRGRPPRLATAGPSPSPFPSRLWRRHRPLRRRRQPPPALPRRFPPGGARHDSPPPTLLAAACGRALARRRSPPPLLRRMVGLAVPRRPSPLPPLPTAEATRTAVAAGGRASPSAAAATEAGA